MPPQREKKVPARRTVPEHSCHSTGAPANADASLPTSNIVWPQPKTTAICAKHAQMRRFPRWIILVCRPPDADGLPDLHGKPDDDDDEQAERICDRGVGVIKDEERSDAVPNPE